MPRSGVLVVEDRPQDEQAVRDTILDKLQAMNPGTVIEVYPARDNLVEAKEEIIFRAEQRRRSAADAGLRVIVADLAIFERDRTGAPRLENGMELVTWLSAERDQAPEGGVFHGWGSSTPPVPYIIVVTALTDPAGHPKPGTDCDELIVKEGDWVAALAAALLRAGIEGLTWPA